MLRNIFACVVKEVLCFRGEVGLVVRYTKYRHFVTLRTEACNKSTFVKVIKIMVLVKY